MTVAINSFCRRQTPASSFSHFDGTDEQLLEIVTAYLPRARHLSLGRIVMVPVPAKGFHCGFVVADPRTALAADWTRRAEGEDPYIAVHAVASQKTPATAVDVILYSHDALGADASTDAEWEVVSINARETDGDEPMTPLAMARNMLGRPGGTRGEYTVEQFATAILYWSRRVAAAPPELILKEFPGVLAGLASPDRGDPYVVVWCEEMRLLPPGPAVEPPLPITMARILSHHAPGKVSDNPVDWAEAVYYWSARPEAVRPDTRRA